MQVFQSETTEMVGTIYIGGYTEDSLWNQGSWCHCVPSENLQRTRPSNNM